MSHFYSKGLKLFSAALITFGFALYSSPAQAQSTWDEVYSLLQTNCTGASGCHGSSNPAAGLDFSISSSDVYDAIVEADPVNPTALAKGNKLIDPGYPSRSFLMRKVAHELSWDLKLETGEGDDMPQNLPKMDDADIEIIRQWVLRGAPETGSVVPIATVQTYYNDTSMQAPKVVRPDAPAEGEGYQMHFGPLFMDPLEESEWYYKYEIENDQDIEVIQTDAFMNIESHHFIIYKFDNAQVSEGYQDGIRDFNAVEFFNSNTDFVSAWQDDGYVELPEGTAYFWEQNSVLDLNYHLKNYNDDVILPAELYLNVYTQPTGTATDEMKADLHANPTIWIQNSGQPVTHDATWNKSDVSVWNIVSHTHKYGRGYDVWQKNPDGTKGDLVYDGSPLGYYDWEHPPIEYYEPMIYLDQGEGLIHEATWVIPPDSSSTGWGFTTNEEMMLIYVQYVDGEYEIPQDSTQDSTNVGIETLADSEFGFHLTPNPFSEKTHIRYELDESANVTVEVFSLMGERVATIASDEQQQPGRYSYTLAPTLNAAANGVYLVKLNVNGKSFTKKALKVE